MKHRKSGNRSAGKAPDRRGGPAATPSPAAAPTTTPPRRPAVAVEVDPGPLRRVHALAAAALMMVYLAVMSGHLASVDGMMMYRQAHAIVFDGSVRLRTKVWDWKGKPIANSQYGIGQSLLYLPGLALASGLADAMPVSPERPKKPATLYYQQLYEDPLYTFGASWIHAVIAAVAAFLVARMTSVLGASARASLWALAFLGIGSLQFAYARGDFAQPLAGLCWMAALLASLHYRDSGSRPALWCAAAAAGYAVLVRPVEGMMLMPVALLVMLPEARTQWRDRLPLPLLALGSAAAVAVGLTLLVNWARSGTALDFGYTDKAGWGVPEAVRVAAVLVSPARGILWQLPAMVLVPLGVLALARRGRLQVAQAMLGLCATMLVVTTCWHVWWGGWCWGLRIFLPAIPLLAVLAGAGVDRLGATTRRWLPGSLLAAGFVWTLPGVLTDLLAGYAQMADGAAGAWKPAAFPPYGAWGFLKRTFAENATDTKAIDVLWLRLSHQTGDAILLVPVLLLALAVALALLSRKLLLEAERASGPTGS
ncbi:MAG: hypothetical protein ABR538_10885 [Candidatus Binatia bacterium]